MGVHRFKICVVGEPMVGKTSFIKRFVYNTFSEKYETTIGTRIFKKTISYWGETAHLTIWDVMGNAGFRNIIKTAYCYGADGLIVIGDITRPETFEPLPDWVSIAIEGSEKELPRILVANKIDEKWMMTEEEVATWSAEIFANNYVMASAKNGDNVEQVFRELVGILIRQARL